MAHSPHSSNITTALRSKTKARKYAQPPKRNIQHRTMEQWARTRVERSLLRREAENSAAHGSYCMFLHCHLVEIGPLTFLNKIKIIHASWLQDKTWPSGMQAPSSDNELIDVTPSTQMPSISSVEILESPSPCFSSRNSRTNR